MQIITNNLSEMSPTVIYVWVKSNKCDLLNQNFIDCKFLIKYYWYDFLKLDRKVFLNFNYIYVIEV